MGLGLSGEPKSNPHQHLYSRPFLTWFLEWHLDRLKFGFPGWNFTYIHKMSKFKRPEAVFFWLLDPSISLWKALPAGNMTKVNNNRRGGSPPTWVDGALCMNAVKPILSQKLLLNRDKGFVVKRCKICIKGHNTQTYWVILSLWWIPLPNNAPQVLFFVRSPRPGRYSLGWHYSTFSNFFENSWDPK